METIGRLAERETHGSIFDSGDPQRFLPVLQKILFGRVGIVRVASVLVNRDPDRAFDIRQSEI